MGDAEDDKTGALVCRQAPQELSRLLVSMVDEAGQSERGTGMLDQL